MAREGKGGSLSDRMEVTGILGPRSGCFYNRCRQRLSPLPPRPAALLLRFDILKAETLLEVRLVPRCNARRRVIVVV
jgi:hypothetical protein